MRLWNKVMIPVLALGLLFAAKPVNAYAANELIDSVSLEIESSIASGDSGSDADNSISVESDSDEYEVSSFKVTNAPSGEWKDSSKPKLEIKLKADSGYAFKVDGDELEEDGVDISGVSGSVTNVSVSSSNKKSVTIKFTMDRLDDQEDSDSDDGDYDLEITDTYWDEDTGLASWEGGDDAEKYELRLFRAGSQVAEKTTTGTDYNFASWFTSSGRYQFRVRAVYSSSKKGSWVSSEYFKVDQSQADRIRTTYGNGADTSSGSDSSSSSGGPNSSAGGGSWLRNDVGWWYCNPDRSYTVNNWQLIDGVWYFFNQSGYRVENQWILWNNSWYYLGENGRMYANQWAQSSGYWYYLGGDGRMWTNAWTPDGYYVNADGVWVQ